MRHLIRSPKPIDLIEPSHRLRPRPLIVCPSCRTRLSSSSQRFALSTSASQRAAGDNKVPFTEKIRRRIWGTESPPGQEDPYGDLSALDRTKKKKSRSTVQADDATELRAPTVLPGINSYVPATTWDGLEQIGGEGAAEEWWDEEERFRGFIPPKKVMSREDLMMVVHRAVVEVFTLRDAGRPMTDAANARDDRVVPETSGVRFTISGEEQKVILSYPDEKVKETILQSTVLGEPVQEVMDVQAQAEEAASEAIDGTDTETPLEEVATTPVEEVMPDTDTPPSTQRQTTLPHDSTWLNISLQDPTLKFAIIKRITQLTGTRIPDPVIQQTNTVKSLLRHLTIPPKPKKLAEVLTIDDRLTALPNVRLLDRRFTPIDREKELGRWKVIERELERRGLPVTGNA